MEYCWIAELMQIQCKRHNYIHSCLGLSSNLGQTELLGEKHITALYCKHVQIYIRNYSECTTVHSRLVVAEVDSGTNASLDCKFFTCLWSALT